MRVYLRFRWFWGVAFSPADDRDPALLVLAPIPFAALCIEIGGPKDDHDSYGC